MEQSEPPVCSHVEGTEGRLWELTAKWFIDTQVPLIIHNGFFPTWFQGFITRQYVFVDETSLDMDKRILIFFAKRLFGGLRSYVNFHCWYHLFMTIPHSLKQTFRISLLRADSSFSGTKILFFFYQGDS